MPIRPLTHHTTSGALLTRRAEVEAEIAATQDLDDSELVRRANITDGNDPSSIRDETLFYHLVEAVHRGDQQLLNRLWQPLSARVVAYSQHRFSGLRPEDAADAQADLAERLWRLAVHGGAQAEYCEVSFRQVVKSRAIDLYKQKQALHNRALRDARLTDEREFSDQGDHPGVVAESDQSIEDEIVDELFIAEVMSEVAHLLGSDTRPLAAWRLRVQGIPVGPSGAPGTLSTHFGVTDRTIRNWFIKVEGILTEWRKRNHK